VLAAATGVALALSACGGPEEAAPLEDSDAEVDGGAVGPDVRVSEDVDLQQVQLEYPLDGVYEVGEDARLFLAITNTGSDPATLVDISGPNFEGVQVETLNGSGLPLRVDADDNLYIGAEGPPDVTLLDLQRSLRSSQSIPVTFTFAEAGEVTVDVMVSAEGETPVAPYDFPDDDLDQDPTDGS
jgi:copper(I)-binding protein